MHFKQSFRSGVSVVALVFVALTLGVPASLQDSRSPILAPLAEPNALSDGSPSQDATPFEVLALPPGAEEKLSEDDLPSRTPLDILIEEGEVIEERHIPLKEAGWLKRNRLVRVHSTNPLIEVEDEFREEGGGGEKVRRRVAWTAEHIVVQPRPGVDPQHIAAMVGGTVKELMPEVDAVTIALPEHFQRVGGAHEALATLTASDALDVAEPDYIVYSAATPNDPRYGDLWGLHNTGQFGGRVDADIDAPEAWDISTGSSVVTVAIIDTGIDYNHPDLAANMWQNPGEIAGNMLDDDLNGRVDDVYGYDFANADSDPMDDNGHGSHCAGTIGAVGNNGVGIVGVAWNVRLMALKFLDASGSGLTSRAALALAYANSMGARISSNSWGGGGYSSTVFSAIQAANTAGFHFVAAAGNDTANNDVAVAYPTGYDVPNVIAVASITRGDTLSSFSNFGATSVDLGAPGSFILSTTPNNTYSFYSGTSMATPHVSGALAVLHAYRPGLTRSQARSAIENSVRPIVALSGQTVTGGVLNLAAALTLLSGTPAPTAAPTSTNAPIGTVSPTVVPTLTPTPVITTPIDGGSETPTPNPSASPTPDGAQPTIGPSPTVVVPATPTSTSQPQPTSPPQPTLQPVPSAAPTSVPSPQPTAPVVSGAPVAFDQVVQARGRATLIELDAEAVGPEPERLSFRVVRRPSNGVLIPAMTDQVFDFALGDNDPERQWLPYRRDSQSGSTVPLSRVSRLMWTADHQLPSEMNLPHYGATTVNIGTSGQLVLRTTTDRDGYLLLSPRISDRARQAGADGIGMTIFKNEAVLLPRVAIPDGGSFSLQQPLVIPVDLGSSISIVFDAGANGKSDKVDLRLFRAYSNELYYVRRNSARTHSFTFRASNGVLESNEATVTVVPGRSSSDRRRSTRHTRLRERQALRFSRRP